MPIQKDFVHFGMSFLFFILKCILLVFFMHLHKNVDRRQSK